MYGASRSNDGERAAVPTRRAYGGRARRTFTRTEKAELKAAAMFILEAHDWAPDEVEAALGITRSGRCKALKRRGEAAKRLAAQLAGLC